MQNLGLVLLVFGFVCATLAAVWQPAAGRWHLGWAALAFLLAAQIFGGAGRLFGLN
jgi:hypothetical protein